MKRMMARRQATEVLDLTPEQQEAVSGGQLLIGEPIILRCPMPGPSPFPLPTPMPAPPAPFPFPVPTFGINEG